MHNNTHFEEILLTQSTYDKVYAARQLKRARNPFRLIIKSFYLNNIIKDVYGPAIDFGCGAGQLLKKLPTGSIGFEVNPYLVETLSGKLNIKRYYPQKNGLTFSDLPVGYFKTFIMSHVLEHFEDVTGSLKKLLRSCRKLGIKRVIIVVPGKKGFLFDDTHKTFIDYDFLENEKILDIEGYAFISRSYFPVNISKIGNLFTFHEMKIIYDSIYD